MKPAGAGRSLALLAVAAAIGSLGCAASTRIYVNSTAQTNDGNTFYMMVRNAGKASGAENYQDVAAKLIVEKEDPDVLMTQPIFPGNPATLTIADADKKDIIIYFFFTEPGSHWRVPLRKPLAAEVFIELGQHQIERVQVRRK